MIVVSDTSPLDYLLLIQAIDVLPQLFHEVYTPQAVMRELTSNMAPQIVRHWHRLLLPG